MSQHQPNTARDLLSTRVVTVGDEERLSDVVGRIAAADASHLAVLEKATGKFIGVVRLKDIARSSALRIFADLVSRPIPLDIQEKLEAGLVIKLMQARGSEEIVVLSSKGQYVGLITRESLLEWWLAELKRSEKNLE